MVERIRIEAFEMDRFLLVNLKDMKEIENLFQTYYMSQVLPPRFLRTEDDPIGLNPRRFLRFTRAKRAYDRLERELPSWPRGSGV